VRWSGDRIIVDEAAMPEGDGVVLLGVAAGIVRFPARSRW
jgi:hypothetical protein